MDTTILSRKKMCFFILVFVALFAKLSSQKIIRVVDEPYYDYDGATVEDPGYNTCRYVQLQCTYRGGCGSTLQSFAFECDDLINNRTQHCSNQCKNTLVGLMSTPEGQKLIKCDCEGDLECELARRQIESCRASVVYATRHDTVVSCTEAQWICGADSECGKALEYYNFNCRAMFRGKRCSQRCKNSLTILSKQRAATKLADCRCEFNERIGNYRCTDIKRNMANLCDVDFQKSIAQNIEDNKRLKQEEYLLWESTSLAPPEFDWPELVTEITIQEGDTAEDYEPAYEEANVYEDVYNGVTEEDNYDDDVTEVPPVVVGGDTNEIPLDYSVDDPETMENEEVPEDDVLYPVDNAIEVPEGQESDLDLVRSRSSGARVSDCCAVLIPAVLIFFYISTSFGSCCR